MSGEELAAEVEKAWQEGHGMVCRGLGGAWSGTYPLRLLQTIAVGLGGNALAHIFDAMAYSYKNLASGLPDLLLWRVMWGDSSGSSPTNSSSASGSSSSSQDAAFESMQSGMLDAGGAMNWSCPHLRIQVRLVEVKGPRDVLSEKQEVWLQILSASGVDSALCKIVEKA